MLTESKSSKKKLRYVDERERKNNVPRQAESIEGHNGTQCRQYKLGDITMSVAEEMARAEVAFRKFKYRFRINKHNTNNVEDPTEYLGINKNPWVELARSVEPENIEKMYDLWFGSIRSDYGVSSFTAQMAQLAKTVRDVEKDKAHRMLIQADSQVRSAAWEERAARIREANASVRPASAAVEMTIEEQRAAFATIPKAPKPKPYVEPDWVFDDEADLPV